MYWVFSPSIWWGRVPGACRPRLVCRRAVGARFGGGLSGLHPTQAELEWGTRWSEAGRRAVRVVYIPPKQSLDGAPERLRLVSGAVRAAYIPPKQSLDGAPGGLRQVLPESGGMTSPAMIRGY